MFPTLTPAQTTRLAAHGHKRQVDRGEVLIEAGKRIMRFFVIVTGEAEVMQRSGTKEKLVAVESAGQFTGDTRMLGEARSLSPSCIRGYKIKERYV
jgi:CRP-like cAMP-binding protein